MVPKEKAQEFADWLKAKLLYTSIGGSVLGGALACANSNGMLLPNYVREEELTQIKSVFEGNITIMETKKTAYGNLVLANDKGAVVDPRFKENEIKQISEALRVEAVPTEIAGLTLCRFFSDCNKQRRFSSSTVERRGKKNLGNRFQSSS